MKLPGLLTVSLSVLLLNWIFLGLSAQEVNKNEEYIPTIGQKGKDVIWVPTPDELVTKMMEVARVTSKDLVIDLGSGDGRTVIAAAKLGARAIGIEYNPEMVELSKIKAQEAGVSGNTKFIEADLFEYDLSDATVITMFLLPEINLKLRPRLLDLKPGTRIVSNTFNMRDWEPDYEVTTEENWNSWNNAYMWIIPAKVDGKWELSPGELIIEQAFQMIHGTFNTDGTTSAVTEGRLNGNEITFKINSDTYTGHVTGKSIIKGSVSTPSGKKEWMATRRE